MKVLKFSLNIIRAIIGFVFMTIGVIGLGLLILGEKINPYT